MRGYVVAKGSCLYAVIYEGVDPITGRERRRWHAAGPDRDAAEQMAKSLAAKGLTRPSSPGSPWPCTSSNGGGQPRRSACARAPGNPTGGESSSTCSPAGYGPVAPVATRAPREPLRRASRQRQAHRRQPLRCFRLGGDVADHEAAPKCVRAEGVARCACH